MGLVGLGLALRGQRLALSKRISLELKLTTLMGVRGTV